MKINHTTTLVVQKYLKALDCPRSLTVWLLFSQKEFDQLSELSIDPNNYIDANQFRDAYLATEFLSKANFLPTTFCRKDKALEKFHLAESICGHKNRDLRDPLYFYHSGIETVIFTAIKKISWILGDYDPDELLTSGDFGPGVTLRNKFDTSRANKYETESHITTGLYSLIVGPFTSSDVNWFIDFELVDHNKVTTVPKNSKTDRTIAIEPGINLWFQKAIGKMIRQRLNRIGLDLNQKTLTSGRTRNQHYARIGSKDRSLATVDFSMASDTISRGIVEQLLPPRWYELLSAARSTLGMLDKQVFVYEKFSSMGNGFTFELETLIFYALALAVCLEAGVSTEEVSVFGDDVIIPSDVFQRYTEVCKYCGFTVNSKKSFSQSNFRESCGSHFYLGLDCKPYYLRKVIRDERDIFKSANGIRRLAHRSCYYGCDRRFRNPWLFLRSKLPSNYRLVISEGFGDGGLIGNFDEACPTKARNGLEGYFVYHITFIPKKVYHESHGLLLARLRQGGGDISYKNMENLRGQGKYSRKRLLIPDWYDLGGWI